MGYVVKTLGTVAQYINGRAFKPSEWEESGRPIIRIQNLTDNKAMFHYSSKEHENKYLVQKGDLLFAWAASLGAHIWKGQEAWLNQHIFRVIPNDDVRQDYLYYYLIYVIADLYAKTHGSGMVHITKGPFMNTPIPVPPLEEQTLIVARIEELFSELDAGVETLQKIKQQLSVYRQAVIEDAVAEISEKQQKKMPFGTYVISYQNGVSKRKGEGSLTPVLRLADIERQQISYSNEFREIGLSEVERNKHLLDLGDLLIIRVNGSEELVGKSIIVEEQGKYTACDHFIRCRLDRKTILPKYAQIMLNSHSSRMHIKNNMVSTAGQNTVSQGTISSILMNVPTLKEQTTTVQLVQERLSICDDIEKTVNQSLQQSAAMRQSILKQAFEGGL